MSTYVLYNSLSGNGTGKTKAEEIKPFLSGKELVFEDVTKITDANAFFAGLNPDDELYLCGGVYIIGMHTSCPYCGAPVTPHDFVRDANGNVVQIIK